MLIVRVKTPSQQVVTHSQVLVDRVPLEPAVVLIYLTSMNASNLGLIMKKTVSYKCLFEVCCTKRKESLPPVLLQQTGVHPFDRFPIFTCSDSTPQPSSNRFSFDLDLCSSNIGVTLYNFLNFLPKLLSTNG